MKNDNLELYFKYEGIGIPANEIEKIRQPFYRATNVKNRRGNGMDCHSLTE